MVLFLWWLRNDSLGRTRVWFPLAPALALTATWTLFAWPDGLTTALLVGFAVTEVAVDHVWWRRDRRAEGMNREEL
ncbi:hypothetical protein KCV87_09375 [Actinosynnema pretiosum subsp. pretiosum]|uniref:Uncharacterized protein n=2 Tax=Actinosynnema TaxID=40566 RepID=C6WH03_ACTMD|nr:hypothetical protein [Actinosynnema mirum]ACU36071.1 hypothetical protein Amir_2126 [Actinosynnema mirum DSM 43827]AXX29525.1 hypothetical protein APASM_2160 [Actinosynnema pretiosum subsp. pretiosum]QUF06240.1 hypothetical protein KCV87_09375 [Actinosynnema pretiosum subsp. pretiosum]